MEIKPFGTKAAEFILTPPEQDATITILEGSVSSGKTWACMVKMLAINSYPVSGLRLITGVSQKTIYNNVLKDLLEVCGNKASFHQTRGVFMLDGVEWQVVGADDAKSESRIRGQSVAIAVCDEMTLMPETFFSMLRTRLRRPGSRLYGTTNPDSPFHFLKQFMNEQANNPSYLKVIHFNLDDNPALPEQYKENLKSTYTGLFFLRFIEGAWVQASGAIHENFSDDLLYDDDTRPIGLMGSGGHREVCYAIDYGSTNPLCCLEAWDDGRTLWIEREFYYDSKKEFKQLSDSQYADRLIEWIGPRYQKSQVIIDPSAISFEIELRNRGMFVVKGNNDVMNGIRHVSNCFAKKVVRVHKRCKHYIEEHRGYAWNEKKSTTGVEEPLKIRDHSVDANRYLLVAKISPFRLSITK